MAVLLAATAGFAVGIFVNLVLGGGWPVAGFAVVLAGLCVVGWWRVPRRTYAVLALGFACVAFGVGRAALSQAPLPAVFAHAMKQRISYEGVVVGDPDVRDTSVRIPVRVTAGGAHLTVLAVMPRTSQAAVGERVHVSGTLTLPEPFATDGGRLFAYDKYLAARGTRALIEYGSIRVEAPAPWYSLPAALARVKHWFLRGLDRALPEPYAALAGGVVIGGKAGLGAELQAAFTRTGLVQIVVLSGYNVMVVAAWVMAALSFFAVSRTRAALAGALALLAFVGVAGLSATAVRAALMALVALYARATGKSYAASRALLATICFMLVWNPLLLPYDPSFELSVVATAGLIWLAPLVTARLAWLTNSFWREAVATTLAAQIAVLPLLLYLTGNLSLVAPLANILAAPAVPLGMGFALVAGLAGATLGATIPALALVAGIPAYACMAYLVALARAFAAPAWAAYTVGAFPFALVLLAYAALAAVAASKRASIKPQSTLAKKASTYFDFSAGL